MSHLQAFVSLISTSQTVVNWKCAYTWPVFNGVRSNSSWKTSFAANEKDKERRQSTKLEETAAMLKKQRLGYIVIHSQAWSKRVMGVGLSTQFWCCFWRFHVTEIRFLQWKNWGLCQSKLVPTWGTFHAIKIRNFRNGARRYGKFLNYKCPVWISGNFWRRMEKYFLETPENRVNLAKNTQIFENLLRDFSVEWFSFRKFSNFRILRKLSKNISVPFDTVLKVLEFWIEWKAA